MTSFSPSALISKFFPFSASAIDMAKLSKSTKSTAAAPASAAAKGDIVVEAAATADSAVPAKALASSSPSANKNITMVGKIKKKKKRAPVSFKYSLHKVLKVVHEDLSISSAAMEVMNNFVYDFFNRIVAEAAFLMKRKKAVTLLSHDIQAAVRLLLPSQLSKFADSEGTKAVAKVIASRRKK